MTESKKIPPEERERNLNRSIDQVWADMEESRMDRLGETFAKLAEERRAREQAAEKDPPADS